MLTTVGDEENEEEKDKNYDKEFDNIDAAIRVETE